MVVFGAGPARRGVGRGYLFLPARQAGRCPLVDAGREERPAPQFGARRKGYRRRIRRQPWTNVPRSEGLLAVAGLFPFAGSDIHDGLLATDPDPELGRQRPVTD